MLLMPPLGSLTLRCIKDIGQRVREIQCNSPCHFNTWRLNMTPYSTIVHRCINANLARKVRRIREVLRLTKYTLLNRTKILIFYILLLGFEEKEILHLMPGPQ